MEAVAFLFERANNNACVMNAPMEYSHQVNRGSPHGNLQRRSDSRQLARMWSNDWLVVRLMLTLMEGIHMSTQSSIIKPVPSTNDTDFLNKNLADIAKLFERIIMIKIETGSMCEAFERVMGEGAYEKFAGELYDLLRAKAANANN